MTGAYIRIERGSEWQNIEIDQLSNDELDRLSVEQADCGWTWAKFLAKWIRDNISEAQDGSET